MSRQRDELLTAVATVTDTERFSGAVRVDAGGSTVMCEAFGLAHRPLGVANTIETQFGIASGTKGLTALAVMALVDAGVLDLGTPARELLGADLPLIDDTVTIEHLLAHRSGIGDYLDEDVHDDVTDYVMPVPVHELASPEAYLGVLDGFSMRFTPGTDFAYCNGGYVVLALVAERAAGAPYRELVRSLVTEPAGMPDTHFHRSDELPGAAAVGYLWNDLDRTNVLHLPVVGVGDGGAYSTVGDFATFWSALFGGRIVSTSSVESMVTPRSVADDLRYGLGFWLRGTGDAVFLEGADAGVSFRSVHSPSRNVTYTVVSNTSMGAWPLTRRLAALLGF